MIMGCLQKSTLIRSADLVVCNKHDADILLFLMLTLSRIHGASNFQYLLFFSFFIYLCFLTFKKLSNRSN